VSSRFEEVFCSECQGDPVVLAAHLNRVFLAAVRAELETGEWEADGILGDDGPLWFRPQPYSDLFPAAGLRQVVCHTPPLPELEEVGFHMIDPCAFLCMDHPQRFRYGVIEDEQVRVEEGTLEPATAGDSSNDRTKAVCR
jgi:hypothetical protein